ncbi:MAG: hypothetical protein JRG96_09470 [Deltaproteobacteria bacterium]|nr:hypothetical protein [Deltaproteobacteria bacterium]MBW2419633.1 hypothetical protein [Deltaproteobacteria bacterium]
MHIDETDIGRETDPSAEVKIPEPRARACMWHGFYALLDNFMPLTVLGGVVYVLGTIGESLSVGFDPVGFAGTVFLVFVVIPLQFGVSFVCLRIVRGAELRVEDFFQVTSRYRDVVTAGLIVGLLVAGGLGLFVLPGIYLYFRTRFTPFLVLEEGLDGRKAILESFRLTRGHVGTVALLCVAGLAASAVGSLALLLGLVPALMWWDLTLASLYHSLVRPSESWRLDDRDELLPGRQG